MSDFQHKSEPRLALLSHNLVTHLQAHTCSLFANEGRFSCCRLRFLALASSFVRAACPCAFKAASVAWNSLSDSMCCRVSGMSDVSLLLGAAAPVAALHGAVGARLCHATCCTHLFEVYWQAGCYSHCTHQMLRVRAVLLLLLSRNSGTGALRARYGTPDVKRPHAADLARYMST